MTVHDQKPETKARWQPKVDAAIAAGLRAPRRLSAWRRSLSSAVPYFFMMIVLFSYIFGVHSLFGLCTTDTQRFVVYFSSYLVVKKGGEQCVKFLLVSQPSIPTPVVDITLFCYEWSISLHCRMLLLRFPDLSILLFTAIATSIMEFGARSFFVWRLAVWRSKLIALATSCAEADGDGFVLLRRQLKGFERMANVLAADLAGDMVVEYIGANIAMAFTFFFSGSAVFRFGSGDLSASYIVTALAAQHGPELVSDLFSLILELRAELPVRIYLRRQFSASLLWLKAQALTTAVLLALAVTRH